MDKVELKSWDKKQAVALHRGFYETLPNLGEVSREEADMAWLIYDLVPVPSQGRYQLRLHRAVYTQFQPVLDQIATPEPGTLDGFLGLLQEKLDAKLEEDENPPDAPTLADLL